MHIAIAAMAKRAPAQAMALSNLAKARDALTQALHREHNILAHLSPPHARQHAIRPIAPAPQRLAVAHLIHRHHTPPRAQEVTQLAQLGLHLCT